MVGVDKLAGDGLMGNGAQVYKEAKLFFLGFRRASGTNTKYKINNKVLLSSTGNYTFNIL